MPRSFGGFGRPTSERVATTAGFLILDTPMSVASTVTATPKTVIVSDQQTATVTFSPSATGELTVT